MTVKVKQFYRGKKYEGGMFVGDFVPTHLSPGLTEQAANEYFSVIKPNRLNMQENDPSPFFIYGYKENSQELIFCYGNPSRSTSRTARIALFHIVVVTLADFQNYYQSKISNVFDVFYQNSSIIIEGQINDPSEYLISNLHEDFDNITSKNWINVIQTLSAVLSNINIVMSSNEVFLELVTISHRLLPRKIRHLLTFSQFEPPKNSHFRLKQFKNTSNLGDRDKPFPLDANYPIDNSFCGWLTHQSEITYKTFVVYDNLFNYINSHLPDLGLVEQLDLLGIKLNLKDERITKDVDKLILAISHHTIFSVDEIELLCKELWFQSDELSPNINLIEAIRIKKTLFIDLLSQTQSKIRLKWYEHLVYSAPDIAQEIYLDRKTPELEEEMSRSHQYLDFAIAHFPLVRIKTMINLYWRTLESERKDEILNHLLNRIRTPSPNGVTEIDDVLSWTLQHLKDKQVGELHQHIIQSLIDDMYIPFKYKYRIIQSLDGVDFARLKISSDLALQILTWSLTDKSLPIMRSSLLLTHLDKSDIAEKILKFMLSEVQDDELDELKEWEVSLKNPKFRKMLAKEVSGRLSKLHTTDKFNIVRELNNVWEKLNPQDVARL